MHLRRARTEGTGRMAVRIRCVSPLAAALLAAIVLSGCSSGNSSAERRQIADDFAGMILVCDSSSAAWDDMLEAVGAYAESGAEADMRSAMDTCSAVYDQLTETLETYTWDSPSEDYLELLENEDISEEDYSYMAMWAQYDAQNYLQALLLIEEDMVDAYNGNMDWNSFVSAYEYQVERQIYTRQAGWYMYVNYWFAEWTGDDLAYVQEMIVDELASYNIDGLPWDDDRASIEERANAITDSMSALAAELEEEVQEAEEAEGTQDILAGG